VKASDWSRPMRTLKFIVAPCLALCMALVALPATAQTEALVAKRATELRDAPGDTANSLATLPAQTTLTRLPARQGPWVQVKAANGQTGWVHMFDMGSPGTTSTVANTAQGALRGLTNLFNRGSAQNSAGSPTSTVGIRGLGAEDIANAQPNLAALAQADTMRMDAAQAKRFAAEAPLTPRTVEPLPEPPPPAPPTPPPSNNPKLNAY
jgi:Bacterial SH3 domain